MWEMIPSLLCCVDTLAPAFTQPSFNSNCRLLLAWVMCLGKHTLFRVGDITPASNSTVGVIPADLPSAAASG